MKRKVFVGMLILLFGGVYAYAAQEEIYIKYENSIDVHPGDLINVEVRGKNFVNLYGIEFKLYYDPRILDYDSFSMEGSVFSSGTNDDGSSYYVWLLAAKEVIVSEEEAYFWFAVTFLGKDEPLAFEDGLIVTVIFEVLSYGQCALDLRDVKAGNQNGEPISVIVTDRFFNNAIMADFVYSPEEPMAGEEITFDGSPSKSNCGDILFYKWDFGDGSTGRGKVVTHTYEEPGSYTVSLVVEDEAGWTASCSKTVTVSGYVEPEPGMIAVDLVRRCAWPEHHHFDISRDEDGFQTFFGKVQNMGSEPCYVKVRFDIDGEVVETGSILLAGGEIRDLSVKWNNYLPNKRYTVYAQTFGSTDLTNWIGGKKIKKFSFAVVE